MNDVTQEQLHNMFNYNPVTGVFTYKKDTPRKRAGDVVGYSASGYLKTMINGKHHNLGKLAWIYVNGVMTKPLIDHINHDRKDNRIDNLREVTYKENSRNLSLRDNKKPYGVKYCERDNVYHVLIDGVPRAECKTHDEAMVKRKELQIEAGYHTNHGKTEVHDYAKHNAVKELMLRIQNG